MSNYSKNQYVEDRNNSWNLVMGLVQENATVLDIGCSSGNFGAELIKQKGCVVDGVEINAADAQLAKKKLRKVLSINIETEGTGEIKEKYDQILMMDVIEHLVTPAETLKKIATLLKPNGQLVFSVPNMAHVSVRLDLLAGKFDYRKTGLLDDTHLHFYTQDYLNRVLAMAGFKLTKTEATTITYPQQLLDKKLKEVGLTAASEFVKVLEETRGNTYQLIGTAKYAPGTKTTMTFPASNPHEEHYKDIEKALQEQGEQLVEFNKAIHEKDLRIAHLEAQVHRITNNKAYKLARHARDRYVNLKGRKNG